MYLMVSKRRSTNIILFILCLGMLAAAGSRINPIKQLRRSYDLDPADPIQDKKIAAELQLPLFSLSIFRSLAIDYLWIRADTLKNAGQYFDALHLSRMICALQPNLASVWEFQAWNMSYNLAVAMPNPPERWNWVQAGFALLRDQGIPACPRNPNLYISLAGIFNDKIGSTKDDFHWFYKQRLAFEMMGLLGPEVAGYDTLQKLADAPKTWTELRQDPNVIPLIDEIKKIQPKYSSDEKMAEGLIRLNFYPDESSPELMQFLEKNVDNPLLHKLDYFIRSYSLREKWKMDPDIMIELNRKYGPVDYDNPDQRLELDWRLPYCHALYWAYQGLNYVDDSSVRSVKMNLYRNLYHSLQHMFHYGKLEIIIFTPPPQATQRNTGQEILRKQQPDRLEIFLTQDLRMFPAAYQAIWDIVKSYEEAGEKISPGTSHSAANFAWAGIENLYLAGHEKIAEYYYIDLKKRFPENRDYDRSLTDFLRYSMNLEIQELSPKRGSEYIDSFLRRSYALYAQGNSEMADTNVQRAQQLYGLLEKRFPDPGTRQELPSWPKLRNISIMNYLKDPGIRSDFKGLFLNRVKIDKPELFDQIMKDLQQSGSTANGSQGVAPINR